MCREKVRRMGWWRRYLCHLPCSSSASSPACVGCLTNACWIPIWHSLSRRLRKSPIFIQRKNEWRFDKYYWPSHCRIWCISSETFRGPWELFIKYRLATRMTNRYRGTLLEDRFYFLLWWANLELFWPEFQALATWWSQLNEVSVCYRVSIMVSIEATQFMRFMIPHVKLNSEL